MLCSGQGVPVQKGEIMKRKYIYTIVAAALLVCLGMSVVFLRPDKEQQLVKEFLDQTFTKSEENAKLYQAVMDSPSVIGLGVDQQTQKETAGKRSRRRKNLKKHTAPIWIQMAWMISRMDCLAICWTCIRQTRRGRFLKQKS